MGGYEPVSQSLLLSELTLLMFEIVLSTEAVLSSIFVSSFDPRGAEKCQIVPVLSSESGARCQASDPN